MVGSDGIYDGLENNDVMDIALKSNIREYHERASTMLMASLHNRSSDNMAAIIIDLIGQNHIDQSDSDSGIESDHDEL